MKLFLFLKNEFLENVAKIQTPVGALSQSHPFSLFSEFGSTPGLCLRFSTQIFSAGINRATICEVAVFSQIGSLQTPEKKLFVGGTSMLLLLFSASLSTSRYLLLLRKDWIRFSFF